MIVLDEYMKQQKQMYRIFPKDLAGFNPTSDFMFATAIEEGYQPNNISNWIM
jgi:hypothetical protein